MSTYKVAILETMYTVHHVKADSEEIAECTFIETDPVDQKYMGYDIQEITKIQPKEDEA